MALSNDKPSKGNIMSLEDGKAKKLFEFNKEQYGDRIRALRIKRGLNQPQLAEKVGVTKNAVCNWEAGRVRPDMNLLPLMSEALGVSISALFGMPSHPNELSFEEQRHLSNYRILPKGDKVLVDRMIDTMIENNDAAFRKNCKRGFERIRHSDLMASAGTGNYLGDDSSAQYVYVRVSRNACRADEIITITGDSMEPTFHDGDELFVEHTSRIQPGEIGIFVAAGEGFVKEYQKDGLHSHNPEYPVMKFNPDDNVRCTGRVLGVLEKDQYPNKLEQEVLDDIYKSYRPRKGISIMNRY